MKHNSYKQHPWDWQYMPFNFYLLSLNAFYKAPSPFVLKENISCREISFIKNRGETTFIVVATLQKGKEMTMLASVADKTVSSQVLVPQRLCAKLVVYSKSTKANK